MKGNASWNNLTYNKDGMVVQGENPLCNECGSLFDTRGQHQICKECSCYEFAIESTKDVEVVDLNDGKRILIQCGDTWIEWNGDNFVKHMAWVESVDQRLKAEQDAHQALRERLKTIEWIMIDGVASDACPVCWVEHFQYSYINGKYQVVDREHKSECWLGNAIKDV